MLQCFALLCIKHLEFPNNVVQKFIESKNNDACEKCFIDWMLLNEAYLDWWRWKTACLHKADLVVKKARDNVEVESKVAKG
jgi:hypothetical protein